MRAEELFEDPKLTVEDLDQLKFAIKRDCKQCLEVYLMNQERPLWRGVSDYQGSGFTGQSRTDRMPRDTSTFVHDFMNEGLRLLGSPVNRSNSLGTTGDEKTAFGYNTNVYAIFPHDGFHFLWSPLYKDFANLGIDAFSNFRPWLKSNHPEEIPNSDAPHILSYRIDPNTVSKPILREFWTHIVKSKQIKIDADFDSAVASWCEVMVTGTYYAVHRSRIDDYFWKDMLTAFNLA